MDQVVSRFGNQDHCPSAALEEVRGKVEDVGGLASVPHFIGVHPVVQQISRIDAINEEFQARGLVMQKWYEPSLVQEAPQTNVPVTRLQNMPEPFGISNAVALGLEPPTYVVVRHRGDDPPGVVMGVWLWNATLKAKFSLKDFPYDTPSMEVVFWFSKIGSIGKDYGRVVVPYSCNNIPGKKPTVDLRQSLLEWRTFSPTLRFWISRNTGSRGAENRENGPGKVVIKVEKRFLRKGNFYVRMMATMGIIATLSFTAFVLDPMQLSERLSVVLTLLVALIAFGFSVQGTLPKVPYATQFDKYMSNSTLLLAGCTVSFAGVREAIRQGAPLEDVAAFERNVLMPLLLAAWGAYHIMLGVRFTRHLRRVKDVLGAPQRPFHPSPGDSSSLRMGLV